MTAKPAPAASTTITLDVTLLGREYKVTCGAHERTQLLDAVAFLDRRMREIRDVGKIAGAERIAVMAALNIAHELLRARSDATSAKPDRAAPAIDEAAARRRIEAMRATIDRALGSEGKHAAGRS